MVERVTEALALVLVVLRLDFVVTQWWAVSLGWEGDVFEGRLRGLVYSWTAGIAARF